MEPIESESRFIWKLILSILKTPFVLLLVIFQKRKLGDLFQPFYDILEFIFAARFTISIIVINIIIFIAAIFFMSEETINSLVIYPNNLLSPSLYYTFFTAGFLHLGFGHIVGNSIFLFIFGRVVERRLGPFKTAIVYFVAMLFGSILYSIMDLLLTHGNVPGLGASGALMGLAAMAMMIDPFYLTFEQIIPLPIMVVGWEAIYLDISGVINPIADGIGHFAHLGGYLSILVTGFLIGEKQDLKKGLIINLSSLGVALILYFLLISGYIPSFKEIIKLIGQLIRYIT